MKKRYLFFIMLISVIAFYSSPFLIFLRKEIKKEMFVLIAKNKISKENLIALNEVQIKKAKWIDAKEFMFERKLYDVVFSEVKENVKVYYCFLDHKETIVVKSQHFINNFFKPIAKEKIINKNKIHLQKIKNITVESPENVILFHNVLITKAQFIYLPFSKSFVIFPLNYPPELYS